jgi:hypothetical protein
MQMPGWLIAGLRENEMVSEVLYGD